jgi:hypothetical protein
MAFALTRAARSCSATVFALDWDLAVEDIQVLLEKVRPVFIVRS